MDKELLTFGTSRTTLSEHSNLQPQKVSTGKKISRCRVNESQNKKSVIKKIKKFRLKYRKKTRLQQY
jgi:hypothetical protein